MDKYKINYIFSKEKDIDDVFIKVLDKELKKYILMICKNEKYKVSSPSSYLFLKGGKHC